jgi:chromosome segregation ATPase
MHPHQEYRDRLEMEVSATTQYVSILRSHLQQIKDEIAIDMKAIHAGYEERIEFAGGHEDALRRLSKRLEVQQELSSLIQPYEALQYEIDKLLEQLEKARTNMQAIVGRLGEEAWTWWP